LFSRFSFLTRIIFKIKEDYTQGEKRIKNLLEPSLRALERRVRVIRYQYNYPTLLTNLKKFFNP
ncbi:MAG: hypothetical protein ACRENT_08505, partial [Thermodesulfobacteriota bacterium]